MKTTNYNGGNGLGQHDLAALASEVRALRELATGMLRKIETLAGPGTNGNGGFDLARATPDQLLDRWQAVRGDKAEAYLYGRITRRRARRAVNGTANI